MKPSFYLKNKAETLHEALDYMTRTSIDKNINERILVFLSQIDFWDWEMEELIFSFKSFNDRAKAWSATDLELLLLNQKFIINRKTKEKLVNIFDAKKWRSYYSSGNDKVFAPYDVLNKTIQKWNELLDKCDKKLMQNTEEFGIRCENIQRFKKEEIVYEK